MRPHPGRSGSPGLEPRHFADYPLGVGYYGWLFDLMFRSGRERKIFFGRFENLREEALRLFEETGTPVTKRVATYLRLAPPLNPGPRPKRYADAYSPNLRDLVADRERKLMEGFGYEFS